MPTYCVVLSFVSILALSLLLSTSGAHTDLPTILTIVHFDGTSILSLHNRGLLEPGLSWNLRKRFSGGVFGRLGMCTVHFLSRLTLEP
jgi:hypothetical protein